MLSVMGLRAEVVRVLLYAGFVLASMATGTVAVTLIKHYDWGVVAANFIPFLVVVLIGVIVQIVRIRDRAALSVSSRNVEAHGPEREEGAS
jgi:hypothetical protein